MKIQLPHTIIELNLELPIEERVLYIQSILENERIIYGGEEISLEIYLHITSQAHHTIVLLDMLGYYMTKGYFTREELLLEEESLKYIKEAKRRNKRRRELAKLLKNQSTPHQLQDNYVLSHYKQKEIKKGSHRHNTFSNTSYFEALALGIEELDEDSTQ
ncbi:hypothetical protein [Lysinibacillus fusiformis]|uniref:hypothetical protein n=1 Tax=Lysinibacillus fusiformis TaxID=28031 RepID=UPI0011A1292D|nr:hypothetical protein [Lysinibacillus fusiformis]